MADTGSEARARTGKPTRSAQSYPDLAATSLAVTLPLPKFSPSPFPRFSGGIHSSLRP